MRSPRRTPRTLRTSDSSLYSLLILSLLFPPKKEEKTVQSVRLGFIALGINNLPTDGPRGPRRPRLSEGAARVGQTFSTWGVPCATSSTRVAVSPSSAFHPLRASNRPSARHRFLLAKNAVWDNIMRQPMAGANNVKECFTWLACYLDDSKMSEGRRRVNSQPRRSGAAPCLRACQQGLTTPGRLPAGHGNEGGISAYVRAIGRTKGFVKRIEDE